MNNLTVQECNGVLFVDSRLVAEELDVNHKDWLRNVVIKYRQEIEADFGVLRFENAKPIKGSPGGRPGQYVLLTEEQATVLMTYSRNTEKVRHCKRKLVKAFSEAKKLIKETICKQGNQKNTTPALPSAKERLETIKLGMNLLEQLGGCDQRTQVQLKDQVRNILLAEKLQPSSTEITTTQIRLEYPVSDRSVSLGYRPNNRQLQQIGKQASRLYQERHDTKPIQREQFVGGATRMVNVYGFNDLDLLDQAILSVMDK